MVESIVRLLVFNIILNQHASDLVITGLLELNGRLDLSRRTFERGGRFHTANGRIGFLRMTDLLPDRSFGNGTRSDTDNQILEIIRPSRIHTYFHLTLQTNPLRTPIRIHWHSFRLVGGNDQKMVTVRFIQRIEISLCRNTIPARHIRKLEQQYVAIELFVFVFVFVFVYGAYRNGIRSIAVVNSLELVLADLCRGPRSVFHRFTGRHIGNRCLRGHILPVIRHHESHVAFTGDKRRSARRQHQFAGRSLRIIVAARCESRQRERRNAGDEIVEKFSSSFHNFSNFG